jgi:hypothetical protein
MSFTSLNKLLRKRFLSNSINKSQVDSSSCSTTELEESWRSDVSESIPQHIANKRASRRSSLKVLNSPRPSRPDSIEFCERVEVTLITPTTRLVKRKSELWFRSKDYERIAASAFEIVDRVDEGTTNCCTRGLENLMKDRTERYDAWDAVLDEQEFQRVSGVYNDEALSSIYKQSCTKSQLEAELRALQDAKDALQYVSDTREQCQLVNNDNDC